MWNNLLFNEIPKIKVIRQINKIVADKNLVITSLSDKDKRAIFDVLNKNAKTRIVSMRFEEDKNYFVINYIKDTSNKVYSLRIHFEYINTSNFLNSIYSKETFEDINENKTPNQAEQ